MIVALCVSTGDQELALKNVRWMNELGGCKGHEVLFGYDKRCHSGTVDAIGIELGKCFDKTYPLPFKEEVDGWPEGANYFFRTVANRLETKPDTPFFFWMEPDAIPMVSGWLDALLREYSACGKPFMGDRVEVEEIPLHMSGVGFYSLPLHQYAGEASRAFDIAWDMAAKEQIVPRAHFTKLIEHAWKHPKFTSHSELATQIRPECILFHSSKDGSLIDLLRGASQDLGEETTHVASSTPMPTQKKELEEPSSPSPYSPPAGMFQGTPTRDNPLGEYTCDIFIRTYPGDYQWLKHCLQSIRKYAKGFRKIWVISPQPNPFAIWAPFEDFEWKVMNDESPDGYLAQQITKLYADVITDYQPDYILHIDSDTLLTRPVTPQDFFYAGRPFWFYTAYSAIQTPWQPIIEKFMQDTVPNEYMRRFPIMVPRWLYPRIREFCHRRHGVIISDYVRNQPQRSFSEFNALGAYAYKFNHDKFAWVDTQGDEFALLPPCARQFHSWGGITPEVEKELGTILGELESHQTAGSGTAGFGASRSLPAGIKELPNGLWVIENDTHVSKWVEQQGRLDHDQNTLPFILPLIKEGDSVIDAGAFIGDHTIAYSKAVGEKGVVHAFEPNPIAYQCMHHNLESCRNVILHDVGLSDANGSMPLSGNNGNYAGAYAGEHMKIADVPVQTLDDWFYQAHIDFIKFDIEGCEVKALIGAQNLIRRCHPTMVIEVNVVALERQKATVGQLFALLESYGYEWKIIQENCDAMSPMYDIICSYKATPEVGKEVYRCSSEPPPVTPLTQASAIEFLQKEAAKGKTERWTVMMALWKAGLTSRNKKKKKVKRVQVPTPPLPEKKVEAPSGTPKNKKQHKVGLVSTKEKTL